ncbi:MAG TPA: porin [Minicystis sp.]|nr:porin [Minicystis sp.]
MAAVGTTLSLVSFVAAAQPAPKSPPAPDKPQSGAVDAPPLAAGEAPPAPPPPGARTPETDAPVAPTSAFGAGEEMGEQEEVAGFRGGFFIRDRRDYFRLYPEALLELDVDGAFGPGVGSLAPDQGKAATTTRLLLQRARLGLEGEILRRWDFMLSFEFGGQPLTNAAGVDQSAAAAVGQQPAPGTARFAPVEQPAASAAPADVWLDYHLCNCFSLMLGQFNAPIGLENRTFDAFTPRRERNLAIRGFVVPGSKDIGAMAFGFFGDRVIAYELGVFEGDGPNRPGADDRFDFMGRLTLRPFATPGAGELARWAQIGVSARFGDRDPNAVGYDYPAITTGQGFALWRPTYVDQYGRIEHVVPSGGQNTIGGELRLRAMRMSLQGEAYYVDNGTREAVDGYQLTNTERLGRVRGAGWYVQLSGWPLGDAYVRPEPGVIQPRQLDMRAPEGRPRRGLEIVGVVAGVNASYDGAARGGTADPHAPATAITLYQVGLTAQYWHTQHVRVALDYDAYLAPGSGSAAGTVVPDNVVVGASGKPGTGHVMHELGGRLTLAL